MNEFLTTLWNITPDRPWGIDIPNYFWFTGSSAAAFIISSFAHVFGMRKYKPIAGFSLLLAFVLLVVAPFNLIDDLRQPGRVIHFFFYGWENFPTSPMKWGVLLLLAYPLLIFTEACIMYREDLIGRMQTSRNSIMKKIYKFLTFGRTAINDTERKKDHKLSYWLGAAGIPLALSVHGYTGYILGAVHAFPLWHTPLMPVLFLASAMVSGTGLLLVLLPVVQKFFSPVGKVDLALMADLGKLLAWFIVIDLVIRFFWLTFAMPFNGSEKYALYEFFSYHQFDIVVIEYIIGLFLPMAVGFTALRQKLSFVMAAGFISAAGVWLFRWNTVIGGQGMAKSTGGLLEYHAAVTGQDSIASVLANGSLFVAVLCLVMLLFPWGDEMKRYYEKGAYHGYESPKLFESHGGNSSRGSNLGL
ncbi:Polysulphide reductase, NrfD [Thermosinus carboxydivorans Nor1]|uniref:Polysulphide reductase, NrfD n=1 Tax=Thermosinus carboxydivorans Nor1 TaxID=401526 RepID=A1HNC8_9FIRM|nr:NrfD/PsrC family molybdoenzyme membrane anchor subunit [Thermosinus carboxydivorans]EAX48291.1 Polysulphide reductase, NrfD [Thermosinus carboxydivorans Nor1]